MVKIQNQEIRQLSAVFISGDNSSVAELEERVETLEITVADHEARLATAETDVEGLIKLFL